MDKFFFMKMCVGKTVQQPLLEFSGAVIENAVQQVKFTSDPDSDIVYTEDILAVSTYYTKAVLLGVSDLVRQFRNSVLYK